MSRRYSRLRPNSAKKYAKSPQKNRGNVPGMEVLERRLVFDSTAVFSEMSYHALGDNPALEWIELVNEQKVSMDISGWSLAGGVDFTFPAGTVLAGGGYLVVATSPSALQTATGFAGALGPLVGQISNSGETLRLVNNSDRIMDELSYGDDGEWPVGPDGGGVTLAKKSLGLATSEPASWTESRQIGGTPGARNFPPDGPQIEASTLIDINDIWKFNKTQELGQGWAPDNPAQHNALDPVAWPSAPALFYVTPAAMPAGAVKNTLLEPPATPLRRTYYFSKTFEYSGDLDLVQLKINPIVDDGAVYYLNGEEVYRQGMPPVPTEINYSTLATQSVANAAYPAAGPFTIPKDDLIVGTNVFSVEVHQVTAGSNDVVFGTKLLAEQTIVDPVEELTALQLNEVAGANEATFRVELYNSGTTPLNLGGTVVTRAGLTTSDYVLPAQTLAAGQFLVVNQATLGFDPIDGDKIFVYSPGKQQLLDGITVKPTARGRATAGDYEWLYTSAATFGATNQFQLHSGVVINEIMYHHRPQSAQPAEYSTTDIFSVESTWKFNDSGTDQGTVWRNAGFNDGSWTSGTGLFYHESDALPAAKNTPLTPGRNTYYFRKSFTFGGSLQDALLELMPIVDDGAVFYLNGQEIYRYNMPDGPIAYGTSALAAVDNAIAAPVIVPATGLVVGNNVLAVEVHQAATPSVGPVVAPGSGYSLAWDGTNGDFFTTANPALAPANEASTATGTTAFGSSQYGAGVHLITHINDGRYGNINSWLANFPAVDPNPYIGLNFNRNVPITSIAWGRDNGNTVTDSCGGTCGDRSIGTYTIQVTNVANPGTSTTETGNASTGWETVATVTYPASAPGFTPYLRHRYTLSENGGPITASGLRIKVSDDDIAIDELEVNAAVDINNTDIVFGTALASAVETSPAVPFAESSEEWIELYNRSAAPVNLTGWRFDEGVDFNFPVGTTIPAGGYLVVASDAAALAAKFPGINVIGNLGSGLANSSDRIVLKDALNNPADDVRYYDGGRWAGYADGGGSSLELRDPDADNNQPEAWSASNESGRSSWETYTYRGTAVAGFPSDRWNEFVLGLFGDGEVLLDDIQVIEFPDGAATHKLQNENFQADTVGALPAAWRINGNERTSRVEFDPENPTNKVLRLVATGQTSDRFNHAETTFIGNQPAANNREYEISFKAKWLAGSNQLNTRLYFNRLAKRWSLDVPQQSGTPGSINSRFATNAGPTYEAMRHSPVIPAAQEPVTVSIQAADADGVSSMSVKYSINGAPVGTAVMAHQGGGLYTGTIPGAAASAIVQFYVEGTDALGAVSTFPQKGAASRALYKVQDSQAAAAAGKHTVRIVMTAADSTLMHDVTNVLSSEELGATVIYNESEVYYDVGVSLKGSMAARPNSSLVGFRLHFQPDHKFRGVHEEIELDRSGRGALVPNGQDELLVKHMMLAAGDIPSMYDDLAYVISPRGSENGAALLMMAVYGDVFLESQYDDGDEGTVFNFDLVYQQNNTHNGLPEGNKVPTGYIHPAYNVDLENLGDDKEQYRWHFQIDNNRAQDDYSRLIEFLQAMSLPAGGAGSALDVATQQLMDVDEWMRMFAAQSLAGVGPDLYGRGLPHNLKLYVRPEDGKVLAFPWDMDLSVFALPTNADPFPSGNLRKVIDIPGNKRLFLGHLQDLMSSSFNSTYLAPWVTHYTSFLPGQNFSGALTYLNNRGAFIATQLPQEVAFNVITTFPNPVNTPTVTISGDAWINVKEIRIQGRDEPLKLTWTDLDSWTAVVPLQTGTNNLVFEAIGFKGNVIATDSVTVTTTFVTPSQLNDLRITEVMYHPLEIDGIGNNVLEFIELKNIGQSNLSLLGVELSGAASFEFTEDVILAPGEYVLLVGDDSSDHMVFRNHYGPGLNIAGALDGNLSNSSEQILLHDSLGQLIHDFTYFDTWHPTTDGDGPSLVIIDDEGPTSAWDGAAGWQPSAENGGSPGEDEPAATSTVAGRHLFYNQSRHDGNSTAANAADDGAIATDKTALMPGGTATFANVSSYTRGINGLMVDIAGLPGTLTAGDFDFKLGNNSTVSGWAALATAPTVSIRTGAGSGGSDRVTLIWPSGSIIKQWLQVTVKANASTGLATPDVFYFGNAIAESGNGPDLRVTVSDEVAARNNPYSAAANGNVPAPVTNKWDYNRDGNVSVTDQTQARANQTTVAARLQLITVPSLLQGQGLVAQSLGDSSTTDKTAAPSALVIVNTTSSSSSDKTAAGEGSVTTSSARSAGRLSAKALEAALSDLGSDHLESDNLPTSAKRGSVASDLLELIAGAARS